VARSYPELDNLIYWDKSFRKKTINTLYEDMSLSTASAPEIKRFLDVVKYCVLSLTPPSGEQSCSKTRISDFLMS
jgi:hypothetical protein